MNTTLKQLADVEQILQETDVSSVPYYADLKETIEKQLTKGFTSYEPLEEHEPIQKGNRVTLSVISTIPKYNKPSVNVNVGTGLYDKTIENRMIGKCIGYTDNVTVSGENVTFTIRDARKVVYPEPTDEMAKYLHIPGIETVDQYKEKVVREAQQEVLENILEHVLEEMRNRSVFGETDEEDVELAGEVYFKKICGRYLYDCDIMTVPQRDLDQITLGCRTKEEFAKKLREGSEREIKNCRMLTAYYGLEMSEEYDPTVNSEAEVQINRRFKEELTRRFVRKEF